MIRLEESAPPPGVWDRLAAQARGYRVTAVLKRNQLAAKLGGNRLTAMVKANWGLGLLSIGLFIAAFASMSYASRNHPIPRVVPATITKPEMRTAMVAPTLPLHSEPRAGAIEPPAAMKPNIAAAPPVEKLVPPKPAEPPEPVEKDPGRHRMRLTAIQAAQAYAQSPCDPATKAAFIVATATYLQAAKMVADVLSWRDIRVRTAVQAAFQAGGISKDEFPIGAQSGVAILSAPHGESASPCGRRADSGQ